MDSQGPHGARVLYTASPLRAFENELGVQDPVGDLLAFKRRRCVELKHGGVSMLATVGYITPEITGKLPGYLSLCMGLVFADVPPSLGLRLLSRSFLWGPSGVSQPVCVEVAGVDGVHGVHLMFLASGEFMVISVLSSDSTGADMLDLVYIYFATLSTSGITILVFYLVLRRMSLGFGSDSCSTRAACAFW